MLETSPQSWSDAEARFRRTLSPALFPSWLATCHAFGAAIAAGPGLVMLVGGPGSGKTFTLLAYAGGAGKKAGLRSIDDPLKPGTEIDLVDNVYAKALARLKPFGGTRALAVEPKLAERLMHSFPDARIVTVQPILLRDVRMMVELRRPQLGLPVGYFTSKALARMAELCVGNPRQLDALLFRSLRLTAAAAVARVSPGHVEQAALQIAMEAANTGQGPASVDLEAALRLLDRGDAPMGSDQPWRPQGANAPGFWESGPVARRNMQRVPSARSPVKRTGAPEWARRLTPLLTSARQAGPACDAKFFALNPAESARAGSRRRRPGRKTLAIAGVAVMALSVTVREVPGMLPWVADGGQTAAGAVLSTVASLLPVTSTPNPLSAVLSPMPLLVAPAAKQVSQVSAPLSGDRGDPVALRDASSGATADTAAGPAPQHAAPIQQTATAEPQGTVPLGGTAQADPGPRGAAPASDRPNPAALTAPVAAPVLAPATAPASDMTLPPQAVAAIDAVPAAGAPSRPEPAAAPRPAASPGTAKEAARLFSLGKALLAINQIADAKELLKASADMGDSKAAALLATYDAAAQGRQVQTGPVQVKHAGARGKPAVRAAPQPGRQGLRP